MKRQTDASSNSRCGCENAICEPAAAGSDAQLQQDGWSFLPMTPHVRTKFSLGLCAQVWS